MPSGRRWFSLFATVLVVGCTSSPATTTKGRIVVAITIDWEGVYLEPEMLEAVENLRKTISAPLTHFVSAAYFTKAHRDPNAVAVLARSIHPGDELAVHLHAWRSLATAAAVEPKSSPSFFSGTEQLLELDGDDVGLDVDLDAYTVPDLRAMLRTSRTLLEKTRIPVSKSFRAGGYLGTPKVLLAIADEGYAVDSSAIEARQLATGTDDLLSRRVAEVWPKVDRSTQPYVVRAPDGLVEMPIAAVADYVTAANIVTLFESADARLRQDPQRDVFVVLGFHLETAPEFASRLGEAMATVRSRKEISDKLWYVTIAQAAELARFTVR